MKKIWIGILLCVMLCCNVAYAENAQAGAYCVTEQHTGTVIAGENAQEQLFPAGLTKLMSYLLFFEALDSGTVYTDTSVEISRNAASKGGTSVFLDAGMHYPFAELLQAAIVSSGNDATVALAEQVAGSEASFTARMNERAAEMDLNCFFADPTGLSAETHASAEDLGKIAAALAQYEEFFRYSTIWSYRFTHESGRETELTNANRLIRSEAYDGMATGSAKDAGYCLAASMRQNGGRFLCIVLDAPQSDARFLLASELLSAAAARYTVQEIVEQGARVKTVAITGAAERETVLYAAEGLALLTEKGVELEKSIHLRDDLAAPLAAGEKAGELIVTTSDGAKYAVDLLVRDAVMQKGFSSGLARILTLWLR